MAGIERVQQLMEELGPVSDFEAIFWNDEHQCWEIFCDQDATLLVELFYDEDQDKLTLSALVGAPSEERRDSTYSALLLYNNLWHETGGVRMAIDSPAGQIVQLYDVFVQGLDLTSFGSLVAGFAERALQWREIMSAGGLAPEDAEVGDDGLHDMMSNALKV